MNTFTKYLEKERVAGYDIIFEDFRGKPYPYKSNNPGLAWKNDYKISLNTVFFNSTPPPEFDEYRLIVILYHEIGHIKFFKKYKDSVFININDDTESEYHAFKNSLLECINIAKSGECRPLERALYFYQKRYDETEDGSSYKEALRKIIYIEKDEWNQAKVYCKNCR